MTQAQRPETCPACGRYPDVGRFCLRCWVLSSHPQSGDYAAPFHYRLAAELLDILILLLGIIPWLVWMWHTSRDGQTPGKQLLGLYVLSEDGQPITPQRIWMREFGIKRLLFGVLGYLFVGLPTIANGVWMLLNPDRQCVHDRMVGTLVVVRREPVVAEPKEESATETVVMPPPAPRPSLPAEPPRVERAQVKPAEPTTPALPPELAALEAEREQISQFEYERRRAELLRRLRE